MLVSDIITDAKGIIGQCRDETAFSAITDAIVVLANKGNYDLLTGFVDICATSDGKTITLPRDIETPLAVNINGAPAYFRNKWYEFHLNGAGSFQQVKWAWDDQGDAFTFMDIIASSPLIAVADLKTDLGATLRVFGYDANGNWIRTQDVNGVWTDGFLVPINMLTDFPSGIIVPDTERLFVRTFSTGRISVLTSLTDHQFESGAPATLNLLVAPLPAPLVNGASYYVRAVSDTTVSLHATQSGALTDTGGIVITSAAGTSSVSLTDRRGVSVLTQFNSVTAHNIQTGMVITFTAGTIPDPIVAGTEYYAHVIDANNFTVHETIDEAESNTNPIDCTTPGNAIVASARQNLDPITHLDFAVNHNFLQGDAVTIQNATGSFPIPLLANVTYYVRYVSSTRITLHESLADATNNVNAIVIKSAGSGVSTVIKAIPCSASAGPTSNITCVGHNLNLAGGDFVQFTTTGTYPNPIAQNTTYRADTPSSVDTFTLRTTAPAAVNILTIGTGQLYLVVSRAFTVGFTSQWRTDAENLSTTNGIKLATNGALPAANPAINTASTYYVRKINANTIELFDTSARSSDTTVRVTATRARTANVATIVFNAAHGWITGDFIDTAGIFSTVTGMLATVTVAVGGTLYVEGETVSIVDGTSHVASGIVHATAGVITGITIVNPGAGFTLAGALTVTGAGSADATCTVGTIATNATIGGYLNGVLATIAISSGGSGYTNGETATLVDAGGHTARAVIAVTAGAITGITIKSAGYGFIIGNSLTITGLSSAAVDAVATVATITDYYTAAAAASTYNGTRKQVTVTGATSLTFASTGLNEPTTADVNGTGVTSDIKVTGLGAGQLSLVLDRTVTVTPFSSLMAISDSQYLQDLATVQFETDGTLPAPLAVLTDYHLSIVNGTLQVKDTLDNNIVLTNIGSGEHSMVIARTFGVVLPTSVDVVNNDYDDGDAVTLATTGTLPSGLAIATTYYLRRITDDTVEVYDTAAHAINTAATTGRIVPSNTGTGVQSMIQVLDNFSVQRITRIAKSASNGFIKLYAWDSGRETALTLIGNFYPDEVSPIYRRIKIGVCCAWVRMRYRRRIFKITSLADFIPVKSKQAILMMMQALKLYRSEFSDAAQKLESKAVDFMNEEQSASDGPDVVTFQFNQDIWTNPDDQTMQ